MAVRPAPQAPSRDTDGRLNWVTTINTNSASCPRTYITADTASGRRSAVSVPVSCPAPRLCSRKQSCSGLRGPHGPSAPRTALGPGLAALPLGSAGRSQMAVSARPAPTSKTAPHPTPPHPLQALQHSYEAPLPRGRPGPQRGPQYGNRGEHTVFQMQSAEDLRMRRPWVREGPRPTTGVLIRRGTFGHRRREKARL